MTISDALNWLLTPDVPGALVVAIVIALIVVFIVYLRARKMAQVNENLFLREGWRIESMRRYAQGLRALLYIKTGIRYDSDDISARAPELLDANGIARSDLKRDPHLSPTVLALLAAVFMHLAPTLRGYAKMLTDHHEGAWPNEFSVPAALTIEAEKLEGLFQDILASFKPKPDGGDQGDGDGESDVYAEHLAATGEYADEPVYGLADVSLPR